VKRYLPLLISATACLLVASAIAAPATLTPPDFTKGDQPGKEHDWTLGPTGARGWIFSANGHSRDARQILVTEVASGSPAEKQLAVGDVILGVNEAHFADDARITFAKAIAAAEAKEGSLKLLRWRSGKTEIVEIKLAVIGSRSATSPYDCVKSKRILELGCASLAKRMSDEKSYVRRLDGISRALNGLALLASGNKDYLPLIQREAKWAADFTTDGYLSWYYGFMMTFVAEYVMATGDTSVMPGLTRLALETARGQSAVGTWGHRFSPNGYNLGGYGAMNAPGIPLTIGMVLAHEAGVKHADLDKGIAKAANFLRWYVHKGAVPYGDHQPFFAHEDNGKCAASAVLFDLLGDREAAEFFAKMAAAGYSERERGHTGNFFNMLWAMQGVARCGPLTSGAYLQEQAWYYDLARSWDTRFIYQGSPVGEEEHGAYKNWDCSGSYLLDCALPLKSLRITGKKAFSVPPLDAAQTAEVIAAGRDFAYKGDANRYEQRPTPQLLAGLASWSPFVRGRSAAALGQRDGDHLPALLKMLAGKERDARYGAIEALGALGPRADAAVPQLRACLTETDPWVQSLAAEAMPQLSPELRKACVSDLLAMTLRDVSIFNDVIGPVMRGPSSSHCAAALRIGRLARDLMDGEISEVLVEFDRAGSLPTTHESQGSDMGLFGGLLGWEADDERLPESAKALAEAGIKLRIETVDVGDPHPNTYRLTLKNSRETHSLIAISTGGGMMEVLSIDGVELHMDGGYHETLIWG
jgi:iron-sulfur-dependent L-serine dehydratase beta subunit